MQSKILSMFSLFPEKINFRKTHIKIISKSEDTGKIYALFKALKEKKTEKIKFLIKEKNILDHSIQNKISSNNIEDYEITFQKPITANEVNSEEEFFKMSIEKMFENYFILMPEIQKYKLKDKITKRQAIFSGFLVAFMLINNMSVTKEINNIYIAMMIYNSINDTEMYIYSELDKNNENINIVGFKNCIHLREKITTDYSLENENLVFFLQSFNEQFKEANFFIKNSIKVFDILKILKRTHIEPRKLSKSECDEIILNHKKNNWLVDPRNNEILINKDSIQKILTLCEYKLSCIINKKKFTKKFARELIFNKKYLNNIIICNQDADIPLFSKYIQYFENYLYDNKENEIVIYYKELERKCIEYFLNHSFYPEDESTTNILLMNKLHKLEDFIESSYYYDLITKDADFLTSLLISTDNYTTTEQYNAKILEKECDIYARLYYIEICLKKQNFNLEATYSLKVYQKYLEATLRRGIIGLNISLSKSSGLKISNKKQLMSSINKTNILDSCINHASILYKNFLEYSKEEKKYIININHKEKFFCFDIREVYKSFANDNKKNCYTGQPFNNEELKKIENKANELILLNLDVYYEDDENYKSIKIEHINIQYTGVSFLIISINYYLDKNNFCVLRKIAIPLLTINTEPKIIEFLNNTTVIISKTIPFIFHPAFESNIDEFDWYDKKSKKFNYDKYIIFLNKMFFKENK